MFLRRVSFFSAVPLAFFLTLCTTAHPQKPQNDKPKSPTANSQGPFVSDVDPDAPCQFGPVYERISEDKSDPRVAFIEVSPFVHVSPKQSFRDLCHEISDQSLDTHALFDKARGFLPLTGAATAPISTNL